MINMTDSITKTWTTLTMFGLFYGISTIAGYLTPNPLYTYILNIYDLVWFGFMAFQPLQVIKYQILFIYTY